MPNTEPEPPVTPQEIRDALAALEDESPTQFTVNVMRKHGGQLPKISSTEISGLFPLE